MSWILGTIGNISEQKREQIKSLHPPPLFTVNTEEIYIAAGGIAATCLHGEFDSPGYGGWNGWIVVGLGIQHEEDGCSLYSADMWSSIMQASEPEFNSIDGHFAVLRYNDREVHIFTDQLGLRGFYAAKINGGVVFSTRLDWAAQLSGNHDIDMGAFGAQWIAFNQISCWSPVCNVHRLGPGGRGKCTAASIDFSDFLWHQDNQSGSEIEYEKVLTSFLVPKKIQGKSISFGLSGGLDSRVLLALYTSIKDTPIQLHVFGDEQDPDVIISKEIGKILSYPHIHEQYPMSNFGELLTRLKEYLAQIYVTSPASAVFNTSAVENITGRAVLMIDGSFGEIARRQCFNRLVLKGSGAIQRRSAEQISELITFKRADIFCHDALEVMNKGLINQVQWYLDGRPADEHVSDEDFADLLTIRTRFPNYSGVEQSRTDAIIMGYMPFLQPSVLKTVFGIPLHLKRNGKLFRRLIQQHCPELAAFPLVKGGTTYPFRFSTIPAHFWTAAKKKVTGTFADERIYLMLGMMKEYISDLVHSTEVQTFSGYDIRKIRSYVKKYYDGEHRLGHTLDWWLSFELWRQSMNGKE